MKDTQVSARYKAFTLIELLITIAVIAILAAVAFVALNPLQRFQDTRDARRASDVAAVLAAAKTHQVDNDGAYLAAISGLTAAEVYMVNDGSAATGCDDNNAQCDTNVTSDTHCANLTGLVTGGYLAAVPVSPNGAGTWTAGRSGYTISRSATNVLTMRSCESENTTEIFSSR
ncbi:prepilin-type N-terminal cleavage/methylation domain-containing protein [Candidatus Uhrbacteria bacterium]|nr:prepilin-type N-terminal cleavage/methylation domain-containing protein [Candidatus Uhrbacteria bacterium]